MTSLARTDTLAKLLIEKGLISEAELLERQRQKGLYTRRCFAKGATSQPVDTADAAGLGGIFKS